MTMQKVEIVLLSIIGLFAVIAAKPLDLGFLTFKDGNIGVNWGGYHASAGLGGFLDGGRTAGGLHASAGTPYGPSAEAGLGGLLGGHGYTGGQLFARAGLGEGGAQAGAGIGGELSGYGAQGGSFAGATTGVGGPAAGVSKTVETHSVVVPQPSIVGEAVEKVYQTAPRVDVVKTVDTHVSHIAPSLASRTVEVSQQIPSHVSAVQTQTFESAPDNLVSLKHVEKVRTHVTPKKIKTRVSTVVKSRVSPSIQSGVIVEKAIYPATNWNVQQVQYSNPQPIAASASAGIGGAAGFYGGGFGGAYGGGYAGGYGGGYGNSYYVKPQPNPQFYDDVFNIPISTLTAVNQLLRNKGK